MENAKLFMELMNLWTSETASDLNDYFSLKADGAAALEAIQDALRLRSLPEQQIPVFSEYLRDCLLGRALLAVLLEDPLITDIKILSPSQIRLKRLGCRKPAQLCFQSLEQYLHFTEYLLCRNGLRFGPTNAFFSFCDAGLIPGNILCCHISSRRVNSVCNPYLHIHRIPSRKTYMKDLISSGMLTGPSADFLISQAKYGGCILLTGNSFQKNVLLGVLLDQLPHNKSALAIQEQEEFFSLDHPEILFQHPIPRSRGNCRTQDLIEYGLLMDSDYFILDELNQDNILPFWKALTCGIRCWTSIQGVTSRQALSLLAEYLCQSTGCPLETIMPSLARISCVACLNEKQPLELMEIKGWDESAKSLILNRIL